MGYVSITRRQFENRDELVAELKRRRRWHLFAMVFHLVLAVALIGIAVATEIWVRWPLLGP